MPAHALHAPLLAWYGRARRDLPWRAPGTSAWGVLVSEVMLQQTPVARVEPAWRAWLARWPTPAALAAESPGEAVRAWGRLGYPRRALRLHAAAIVCVERYGGQLPRNVTTLRELPGVGEYTAAAVAAFAFRQRHAVLDTNVRRVVARLVSGQPYAPLGCVRAGERTTAQALLPDDPDRAAAWSVALMELGALVCTSRRPDCARCPVAARCAWRRRGTALPAPTGRAQAYEGTDRQARGRLLAVVRDADTAVPAAVLDATWPAPEQRARALTGLLADGLLVRLTDGRIALPHQGAARSSHDDPAGAGRRAPVEAPALPAAPAAGR